MEHLGGEGGEPLSRGVRLGMHEERNAPSWLLYSKSEQHRETKRDG